MTNGIRQRNLLWLVPSGILVLSYTAVCLQTHSIWPWLHVVHEDMQSTLFQTVFGFEHATREIPMDLVLALTVAGSVRYFYPMCPSPQSRANYLQLRRLLLALALITLGTILGGSLLTVGLAGVADNLAQLQTRPGEALQPGAHWRYHFLERVALMFMAFSLVGWIWLSSGRPASGSRGNGRRILIVTAILFVLLSMIYGFSLEPFINPRFIGHQARELLTHAAVTLPLTIATTLALARRFAAAPGASRPQLWPILASAIIAFALGVYLMTGTLLTGAVSLRQTPSLAAAVFPHVLEHALGYLLVTLVAGCAYLWPENRVLR